MVMNVAKTSQKMKKINWLSLEKISQNEKKFFVIIIRKKLDLKGKYDKRFLFCFLFSIMFKKEIYIYFFGFSGFAKSILRYQFLETLFEMHFMRKQFVNILMNS